MSTEIIRVARRARRLRIVDALRKIRKPFPVWPLIRVLTRQGRAFLGFTRNGPLRLDTLKKPLPAYAMLIVLIAGIAGGAYTSLALTHGIFQSQTSKPDFNIETIPASLTINRGTLATFTIRLSSLYNFAGSVNLTTTQPFPGTILAANPNSVSLFTGNATSTLTGFVPSNTPLGTYTTNVTGTNGRLSHTVQVFLVVTPAAPPDFTINANPNTIALSRGTSASASLTLSSITGFSGTINQTVTISPAVANGPTATLNPTTILLPSGGTANSLLSVSSSGTTPRGTYTIYVLASSGALSHSVSISLTVQ